MDRIQEIYNLQYATVYTNGSHTADTEEAWDVLTDASEVYAWLGVQSHLNAAETYPQDLRMVLVNRAQEQLDVYFDEDYGSFPKP